MGRSSRPKKSPTLPDMPFGAAQTSALSNQSGSTGSLSKPLYLCNPFVRSALIKGSFKTIVVLPKYVDKNEWIAVNCEYTNAHIDQAEANIHLTLQYLTFSTT